MKALLHTASKDYSRDLAIGLIPCGIEAAEVHSADEMLSALKQESGYSLLLSDCTDAGILRAAREIRPVISIFLVVRNSVEPSVLKGMAGLDLTSIINYSQTVVNVVDEVARSIIANNINSQERRSSIRIKPQPEDIVAVTIYIKDLQRFIPGTVLDISTGGFAVQMKETLDTGFLTPGIIYNPVNVLIIDKKIKTQAQMIGKLSHTAGFKFNMVETEDMRKIAEYIYSRISRNPES